MSETPIIDAAVAAYMADAGASGQHIRYSVIAALRAALRWTPPVETIEAMAEGVANGNPVYQDDLAAMHDAYCAQPLMRELYDAEGAPR